MFKPTIAAFAIALSASAAIAGGPTEAPADAVTYIISPADGEVVSSPVTVVFGLVGMGVAPAGVDWPDTGHHHLILNRGLYGSLPSDDMAGPVPADDNHRHFGLGQTQVTLDLPPGEHTMQLVLGDHEHVPHASPVMSKQITVTVR